MSIKVSKLYHKIQSLYAGTQMRAFNSGMNSVIAEGVTFHIGLFVFQPTDFCELQVSDNNITVTIDDQVFEYSIGHAEPDLFPLLLRAIVNTLRDMRVTNTPFLNQWIGEPLLTELVNAGYIEETRSWKIK